MLCRYRFDPSHVISPVDVEIQTYLMYGEKSIRILARVLWDKLKIEEAMWEPQEAMRKQHPNFFTSKIFVDENP
ncbi:integrase [Gossypium australe]|uniref:Integrase n=1 Tax=Gossypium australe TaxID=47621 RepID=A0A5B6UTP1_9ROSI|nr:integrase [Gossypium australe]